MRLIFSVFIFAVVMMSSVAQAADARWENLLGVIARDGFVTEAPFGDYRTLSRVSPEDLLASHQTDQISQVGSIYGHVEAISENWVLLTNGNWDIDQWMFVVNREGSLQKFWRYQILKNSDGEILKHDLILVNTEQASKVWMQTLEAWYLNVAH